VDIECAFTYFCGVKKAIATMVCLCLIAQCLIQLGVVGYYELNKAYIVQNLCENRDKPQMKCCGKCYLRKQLQKAADHSEDSKGCPGRIVRQEEAFFLVPSGVLLPQLHYTCSISKPFNPGSQHLYGHMPIHTIFRPPIG